MTRKEFKATLKAMGAGGAWICLEVPFNVEKVWGSRARVSVRGTLNGFSYRSSIFPMGDGSHFMMVNQTMQKDAAASSGDTVKVVMEPDTAPRTVKLPIALKKALTRQKAAETAFERLSYSHKKQFVDWILEAKKPEIRARRIGKTVRTLMKKARARR